MIVKLPTQMRPDTWYRPCAAGVDLPREFIDNLKQIHPHLYPVWHQYRMLWETIIQNDYYGEEEDPRHQINYQYGHLNFGFVLMDSGDKPLEDGSWHIWEFKPDHGWGHVCKIEARDPKYLRLFLHRLKLQADWNDRYGRLGSNSYQKYLDQLDSEQREKHMKEKEELMTAVQDENNWLLDTVKENLGRGIYKPTDPKVETITSYPGQKNRSRIIRSLRDDDKQSGLYLPD